MNQFRTSKSNSVVIKIAFIVAVALCLFPFVNAPIALVGGFLFVLIFGHPFQRHNSTAVNWLLKIAVVGLALE